MLMPGRTIKRTYHFNWVYILREVLGDYYDLPDEDRQMQLLQQIARKSLEQGIPLSHAQGMTLEHPLFHNDPDLVKKKAAEYGMNEWTISKEMVRIGTDAIKMLEIAEQHRGRD